MRVISDLKLAVKSHTALKELYKQKYGTDLGVEKHVFGIFGDVNISRGTLNAVMLDWEECEIFNEAVKKCLNGFKKEE